MLILILFGFVLAIGVPVLITYLVIRYLFALRKRQNDEFLEALGCVIRKSVTEAFKDLENKND